MASRTLDALYDIAVDQAGVFTATQAVVDAGVSRVEIDRALRRGDISRYMYGIYCLSRYPITPAQERWAAVLFPTINRGAEIGVLSHETALEYHTPASDIAPAKIDVTALFRTPPRRSVPTTIRLHIGSFIASDITYDDNGLPYTSKIRTLADCMLSGYGGRFITDLELTMTVDEWVTAKGRVEYVRSRHLSRDNVGIGVE